MMGKPDIVGGGIQNTYSIRANVLRSEIGQISFTAPSAFHFWETPIIHVSEVTY